MVIDAPLRIFSRINEFTSLGMAGRAVSHLRLDMLISGFTFVLCNLVLTTVPMDVARKSGFFFQIRFLVITIITECEGISHGFWSVIASHGYGLQVSYLTQIRTTAKHRLQGPKPAFITESRYRSAVNSALLYCSFMGRWYYQAYRYAGCGWSWARAGSKRASDVPRKGIGWLYYVGWRRQRIWDVQDVKINILSKWSDG